MMTNSKKIRKKNNDSTVIASYEKERKINFG